MKNRKQVIVIALILVLGALAPMLDTTMTNIAINKMINALNTTVNVMQWVTTIDILAIGIFVPITGWLIDQVNGKWLYLTGILIFGIGSFVSATSSSVGLLIIGRLIQGIATGIIVPVLSILLVRASKGIALGSLMSIIGLPVVLAPILGPTFGGLILHYLNWRWIFFANIPIVILSLTVVCFFLPNFKPLGIKSKFDLVGFLLLSGMFIFLIIGITNFSNLPKESVISQIIINLFVGIDLLIAYLYHANNLGKTAIVPLSLFKLKNYSASTILLFMSGITVNGAMFLLPLYLQNVRGLSTIMTGIYLIPQGVGLLLARSQIGKLTDRFGAKWPTVISIIISVISTLPFAVVTKQTSPMLICSLLLIRGAAEGGLTIPVMADSYQGIGEEFVASATTGVRIVQNVGGAFGTALLATIIQIQLNGNFPTISILTPIYQVAFIGTVIGTILALIPALFLSNYRSGGKDK
ncbi:DHA2 family efflux MFS transporter permease subunit [Oenococcus oeni]|uniref:DHA2 family efflux MFS transporter permease subunit n=1 Tax=Oenococcus oeni TaxID=1247 RepID=UPI0005181DB4|nr:DHA2 family efflux MFS transporter permease subunit [Oenococcus oeni]